MGLDWGSCTLSQHPPLGVGELISARVERRRSKAMRVEWGGLLPCRPPWSPLVFVL